MFFFFFLSDSRIVSHSPFSCKWQNKFWDNEHVVAYFLSNKGRTLDIQILCSSPELHPAPRMRDVCRVHGLGLSHTSKQNVFVFYYFDSISETHESKEGHM